MLIRSCGLNLVRWICISAALELFAPGLALRRAGRGLLVVYLVFDIAFFSFLCIDNHLLFVNNNASQRTLVLPMWCFA